MQDINHAKRIEEMIKGNKVFVFMKGSPAQPACGFSAKAADVLKQAGIDNPAYFDVLEDPEMRQAIKDYSNWPTVPQIFINGNFVGGSDIIAELLENGELVKMLA